MKPYVDDPNILYCYVSKKGKEAHGISTPDAIAWDGEYGGWDSYLKGEANFAAIGYDWLVNFTSFLTPEDPAGSIEYFGRHKRAAKASDVTSGMALVKDLSHRGLFSLAEAQAYSWEGLYFDVNITGGECTHSSNVGGINVLYGGLNAEKRTWAQLEVQMAQYTSTWGGAGNFYYW